MRALTAVCRPARSRFVLVVAACAGLAARLPAQEVSSQVSVAAGSVTDERGIRSDAVTLAPSVTFTPGMLVSLGLAGSASRFADANWQLGASGTFAARTDAWNGAALSFNAGGGVSRSSYGATFALADVMPALEWSVGPLTGYGGAHLASGDTRLDHVAPPQGAAANALSSIARTSAGAVYGLQWRLADGTNGVQASLGAREERATVAGELVIDRSAGVTLAAGPVAFAVTAVDRVSPSERARVASGSASFALSSGVSLDLAAGAYPTNRLTGAAPGRFVSAGFSLRLGGAPRALPAPRGVPAPAAGMTRLSIRAEGATRVEVAGDWNDWSPALARRDDRGIWYVDLPLAPGEYRYAFRIDGTQWRVPDAAATADDGFGGRAAYVTVARGAAEDTHQQEEP